MIKDAAQKARYVFPSCKALCAAEVLHEFGAQGRSSHERVRLLSLGKVESRSALGCVLSVIEHVLLSRRAADATTDQMFLTQHPPGVIGKVERGGIGAFSKGTAVLLDRLSGVGCKWVERARVAKRRRRGGGASVGRSDDTGGRRTGCDETGVRSQHTGRCTEGAEGRKSTGELRGCVIVGELLVGRQVERELAIFEAGEGIVEVGKGAGLDGFGLCLASLQHVVEQSLCA